MVVQAKFSSNFRHGVGWAAENSRDEGNGKGQVFSAKADNGSDEQTDSR
jgi:hypothetical protein